MSVLNNDNTDYGSNNKQTVRQIVENSVTVSLLFGINLYEACISKMTLNAQKYPVHMCDEEVSTMIMYRSTALIRIS